ncbi:MAG: hypothetical protein JW839_13850 [Candidatus Lokiarchaeota archaeon]|nr:hypothetical protein [Candidatus Lokiarchaeota archaeon]
MTLEISRHVQAVKTKNTANAQLHIILEAIANGSAIKKGATLKKRKIAGGRRDPGLTRCSNTSLFLA